MIASTRLQRTPSAASTQLRLAEECRRRGDLDAARRAYRRSIAVFLHCGLEVKAMAVKRALDGLRPPPPKPSRARLLAERILLVLAALGKPLIRLGICAGNSAFVRIHRVISSRRYSKAVR